MLIYRRSPLQRVLGAGVLCGCLWAACTGCGGARPEQASAGGTTGDTTRPESEAGTLLPPDLRPLPSRPEEPNGNTGPAAPRSDQAAPSPSPHAPAANDEAGDAANDEADDAADHVGSGTGAPAAKPADSAPPPTSPSTRTGPSSTGPGSTGASTTGPSSTVGPVTPGSNELREDERLRIAAILDAVLDPGRPLEHKDAVLQGAKDLAEPHARYVEVAKIFAPELRTRLGEATPVSSGLQVRFDLVRLDGSPLVRNIPADLVVENGSWRVTRASFCFAVGLVGIACPLA